MLGMVGHMTVSFADNVMVGQLGAAELAAVSLANSFFFIAMSLAIGFIFGRWYGSLLALTAATIGAILVFWIARYLIADWARPKLEKMKSTQNIMAKLQDDAFSYLLFMRAVPLFPFWFVNMVFAFSYIFF